MAGYLALLVLILVLSVSGYALFAWVRSGRLPDLPAFWQYQEIYYAAGYFMLPMKRCELWQPIIFLYLVVVAGGVRRALQGTADAGTRWNLFIALYGLGVFSYYQGRSEVTCLAAVLYPAMILAVPAVGRSGRRMAGRRMLSEEPRGPLFLHETCRLLAADRLRVDPFRPRAARGHRAACTRPGRGKRAFTTIR